jgi:intracellular sulfur oxidation DsrE/DsrF family protein
MRRLTCAAAAAIACLVLAIAPAHSEGGDDQAALSGLSEVKVAFDLTNGDGKALLKQLEVIDETRQSLIKQGVKPLFVITFRGPATKLVQTDKNQIKAEDRESADNIAKKITALSSADGVAGIEQCGVAVRLAGTKAAEIVPGVKVVGNGWISLMAYQAKGYGYIAP